MTMCFVLAKRKRFQNFANKSRKKVLATTSTHGDPSQLPKWKAVPPWKDSGVMEELRWVRRIAVDRGIPARELPANGGTEITVCTGPRRMVRGNAQLMVFRSMAQLHKCPPDDWEHLCDLIYIIGLGLPVVVASTWRMADGDPSQLAARASGIAIHQPALENPYTFMLDRALARRCPELSEALGHCARQARSRWKVLADTGRPLGANVPGTRAATINQLAAAVLKLRKMHAGACRGYHADWQ